MPFHNDSNQKLNQELLYTRCFNTSCNNLVTDPVHSTQLMCCARNYLNEVNMYAYVSLMVSIYGWFPFICAEDIAKSYSITVYHVYCRVLLAFSEG